MAGAVVILIEHSQMLFVVARYIKSVADLHQSASSRQKAVSGREWSGDVEISDMC